MHSLNTWHILHEGTLTLWAVAALKNRNVFREYLEIMIFNSILLITLQALQQQNAALNRDSSWLYIGDKPRTVRFQVESDDPGNSGISIPCHIDQASSPLKGKTSRSLLPRTRVLPCLNIAAAFSASAASLARHSISETSNLGLRIT